MVGRWWRSKIKFIHNRSTTDPQPIHNRSGFSLAELLIATMILAVLIAAAASVSANVFNSIRNIKAANLVYEEARFTMERIVKEVRNGTIDYEEYYNQALNYLGTEINETYGQDYCNYSRQFLSAGPDRQFGTFDDENTGIRNPKVPAPIESPIQDKLYIINKSGDRRTYIRRIEKVDSSGVIIGKVGLVKLIGKDCGLDHLCVEDPNSNCPRDTGEQDGLVDTWVCEDGFNCPERDVNISYLDKDLNPRTCSGKLDTIRHDFDPENIASSSFLDITPDSLNIIDLQFIITPSDDPHKAYKDLSAQVHPSVTIKLIAQANKRLANEFKGGTPGIILETTVSTRAYTEIVTKCNLQECINGTTKECPNTKGVCGINPLNPDAGAATQTCTQSIWAGCFEEDYREHATTAWGADYGSPLEYSGCETLAAEVTDPAVIACKQERCTNGLDNDCDGIPDYEDLDCLNFLCTNGIRDDIPRGSGDYVEDCIDVGGICAFIRPLEQFGKEISCEDGYDNDCNFDPNLDPDPIINAQMNIDAGQGADEYDQYCIDQKFCLDGFLSPSFPNKFGPAFYLTPGYLMNAPDSDELKEVCIDVGGLCNKASSGIQSWLADPDVYPNLLDRGEYADCAGDETCERLRCSDGYDNDCDYDSEIDGTGADEFDSECVEPICSNNIRDCDLVDDTIVNLESNNDIFKYYLVPYTDILCSWEAESDNDETCADVGGVCGGVPTDFLEITKALCFNNKDDDCSTPATDLDGNPILIFDGNRGEYSDPNCCPDFDLDTFTMTSLTCSPEDAQQAGKPGEIDCNDSAITYTPANEPWNEENHAGKRIFPGASEVCDMAKYPSDYPSIIINGQVINLANTDIDNNCSGVNLIDQSNDTGKDYQDPECCIDLDGDNFGLNTAYIYNGDSYDGGLGSCRGSASAPPERPRTEVSPGSYRYPDCDDSDPFIHPNIIESTPAQCSDGINNNCRVSTSNGNERIDHIDMYADDAGGIAQAALDFTFEPECCDLTAMEVCDDSDSYLDGSSNSDENCNGLAGLDDKYCVYKSGLSFHDHFTSTAYLNVGGSSNPLMFETGSPGIITISDDSLATQTALSEPIPVDTDTCSDVQTVTLTPLPEAASLPAGTSIDFEVANDGTNFETYTGADHSFLATSGNSLRWKAILNGDDSDGDGTYAIPTLDSLTISFTCN